MSAVPRRLHLQPDHPLSLTRQIIESRFPAPEYKHHNDLFPVVTTAQNFDSLGFPPDHPGRNRTDTYYINRSTVLRTHTSAHQVDIFRADASDGFTISADVYRRDAIDRTHYPIFHQIEGARVWDRSKVAGGNVANTVWRDLERLAKHDVTVEDPNPTTQPDSNPLQEEHHTLEEAEAISAHLKRSLERVVIEIFSRAREAALNAGATSVETEDPLKIRWVPAYFPFTSPSWELEVFWEGRWLELLGCGVVKQDLLIAADVPNKVGWAFGLGLERIAMLLFSIPDIRLFWSQDPRFLSQFSASSTSSSHVAAADDNVKISRYVPISKHPACHKDVSFWLQSSSSSSSSNNSAGETTQPNAAPDFHENDVMEIVRDVAGDVVEDVVLVDEFVHPSTARKSLCYRINYRSLDRTLTNAEANRFHDEVKERLVSRLGVEMR